MESVSRIKHLLADKYKRQKWHAVAPCVHTRNDILSSQNTIHPKDDRVFSLRELMRMMSVPKRFKWTTDRLGQLNHLSGQDKKKYLQKNEMNIRQCLGEAVPTRVIFNIATKAMACIQKSNATDFDDNISSSNVEKMIIASRHLAGLESLMCQVELSNENRHASAAFYTPPVSAFKLLQMIPNLANQKRIRVLEPSVGIGRILHFLPQLLVSFDEVIIDAIDVDKKMLSIAEKISSKLPKGKNLKINFIRGDFLDLQVEEPYDLIIGNPPFGKIPNAKKMDYSNLSKLSCSRNIFALFICKALSVAKHVVLVAPKSILNAPDTANLRTKI